MKLVRGLYNLKDDHYGSVLTIGNFDGVHLGHQQILRRLKECAAHHKLPASVMIFEPHPEELFAPDKAPARLASLREKLILFKKYKVERVILVKFNHTFSKMKAEDFIEHILLNKLGVKHLIVGDDFKFGFQRSGDFNLLKTLSKEHQFQLENTETLSLAGRRISSTFVREVIANGDFRLAEQLLGRAYSMSGRVFHGDKRGRTIGFPTANIRIQSCNSPVNGVYGVKLRLINREGCPEYYGVANVGTRPTVGGVRKQLEVHCFELDESIYSEAVSVQFCHYIRGEKKFDSIDLLIAQIIRDAQLAEEYFNDQSLSQN